MMTMLKNKVITYTFLALFCLISRSRFANTQANVTTAYLNFDLTGYSGCFVKDLYNPDFTISMPHLDPTSVTPDTCKLACQSMSYPLASFQITEIEPIAKLCMCSSKTSILTQLVDIENCRSIPCSGDPSLACGSSKFWLVYKINKNYQIRKVTKTNATSVLVNSIAQYGVEYGEAGTNTTSGNYSVSYAFTNVGQEMVMLGSSVASFYDPLVSDKTC
jgi:hypothetical protein